MINDFGEAALYYDRVCTARGKNYDLESRAVEEIIRGRFRKAQTLLDVACGTGGHLAYLRLHFSACGIDKEHKMLDIARGRCLDVPLFHADMLEFDLQRTFDSVICMYGSISYLKDVLELESALRNFRKHVSLGGVVIIEPFVTPGAYRVGDVVMLTLDERDLKIARMHVSARQGDFALVDHHFMVAEATGVRYFVESHKLTLFKRDEFLKQFEDAGFHVQHVGHEAFRNGLYVGISR